MPCIGDGPVLVPQGGTAIESLSMIAALQGNAWATAEALRTAERRCSLWICCMIPRSPAFTPLRRKPPLQRALEQYLQGLDEKEKAKDFFAHFRDQDNSIDPSSVNRIIQDKVDERWLRSSTTGQVLQTLASIQMNYDSVVNSLISFDPTPISGAVWACVGALAKAVDCYFKVPEKITKALASLGDDLKSIETYNRLFGSSLSLEDVFCKSYVDIFRFWSRVFRELLRNKTMRFIASLSLRSDKFDTIIADMRDNTERVKRQIKLVRETRSYEEKQEQKVRLFLGNTIPAGPPAITDNRMPNSQRSKLEEQCCEWIFEEQKYRAWLEGESTPQALWVHGPPGSGKSTLCRKVAQSVERNGHSVAVASHFFRFDQNYATIDVLKSLAAQLWEQWALRYSSSYLLDKLARFADEGSKGKEPVQQATSILRELVEELPTVYLFLDGVDEEVAKGVDGGPSRDSQKNALEVLDLMDNFVTTPGERSVIRLWISSQDVPYAQEKFKMYTPFNIKEAVKTGIHHYLSRTIGDLTVVPLDRRDSILQELTARAESNFLWAHLMVIELRKATTPAEMDQALEDGRADDLDEYYGRFFNKRLSGKKDLISRDVFSLVTFARWPLKIGEIQEAVAILRSGGGRLNDSQKPFLPALFELFSPLIEVLEVQQEHGSDGIEDSASKPPSERRETNDSLSKTCRLFHSTLFDFLQRHADLLYEEGKEAENSKRNENYPDFRVCQLRIADACLLYLSQTTYSRPLRLTDDIWVDMNNVPVSKHYFLTYSAKNWDKHLDLVAPDGSDFVNPSYHTSDNAFVAVERQFRASVLKFLTSPNFQTCLQVQSLWVDGTFCPYRAPDSDTLHIRRNLPRWTGYNKDYHSFWWEWSRFLGFENYLDVRDLLKPYKGELDRCWWRALGLDNFLSNLESRYHCFQFKSVTEKEETKDHTDLHIVLATPDSVKILWLTGSPSESHNGSLNFTVEVWKYGTDKSPFLAKSHSLLVEEATCKASLYAVRPSVSGRSMMFSVSGEGGRAPLAAFSDDGQCLRIGTQVYVVDATGEYRPFAGIVAQKEEFIEEFTGHADVVVIARRGGAPFTLKRAPHHGAGKVTHGPEGISDRLTWSGVLDEDSASDSSSTFDDRGYESWSDCSSMENDRGPEVESESGSTSSTSSEQGDPGDDNESTDSEPDSELEVSAADENPPNEGPGAERQLEEDTCHDKEDEDECVDSGDEWVDSWMFDQGEIRRYTGEDIMYPEEDEDDTDNDEASNHSVSANDQIHSPGGDEEINGNIERSGDDNAVWVVQRQQVSLRVFTPAGRHFLFTMPIATQLSNSPPVLHPTQPLVVWPLTGWKVLFADYEDNTYFIRELGAPSSETSNILMKCHFTDDGQFLHVASFEARSMEDLSNIVLCGPSPTYISLAVYTYRLCAQKPTRTPPYLVHTFTVRAADLFEKARLYPKFPYTLHWTRSHLYATRTSPALQVYRIPLFQEEHDELDPRDNVGTQFPKEAIPLPASAAEREVFFFPSEDGAFAHVVVGGLIVRNVGFSLPRNVVTPVGCVLNIEEDIGGWVTQGPKMKRYSDASRVALDSSLQKQPDGVDCVLEPLLLQDGAHVFLNDLRKKSSEQEKAKEASESPS